MLKNRNFKLLTNFLLIIFNIGSAALAECEIGMYANGKKLENRKEKSTYNDEVRPRDDGEARTHEAEAGFFGLSRP
jgi:hypothetical protein